MVTYELPFTRRKAKSQTTRLRKIGETTWFVTTHFVDGCLDSAAISRRGDLQRVRVELHCREGSEQPIRSFRRYLNAGQYTTHVIINSPYLLQDGELNGSVVIRMNPRNVSTPRRVSTPEEMNVTDPFLNDTQLACDYLRLLNEANLSDASLKCGSDSIPVHKCILSARSPVFAAMFQNQMQESHKGVVHIDDMEPSSLRDMLRYVYGGKTDHITDEMAEHLLLAAEKYQLEELKSFCVAKLMRILTLSNVFRFFILGDLLDKNLKATAMEFICRNIRFSQFEETEEWKSFQEGHPALACEVLIHVVKCMQEKYVYD